MGRKETARRGFEPPRDDEVARVRFLGAVGGVTGSRFLVETRRARVLVDCGLFQGGRDARARNRRRLPFDPRGLDAVVQTHAHIDHSGALPRLVRDGFRGPVHATEATADLLGILLLDSAHIHEQDAARESRRRLRRGAQPVEPLYTADDARRALELVVPAPFDAPVEVAPGVELRFRRAGHILGAASVVLALREDGVERTLVVSGDVGRTIAPLLRDPEPPERADLLLLESTYGGREHRPMEATLDELAGVLDDAARADENVIVPVFAVGRAQEVLHHVAEFEREGRIPARPVFLDSPMAIDVTALYARHPDSFERPLVRKDGESLLRPRRLTLTRTPEESMAINRRRGVVVLAGSGMCDAGRVVHHLKHNLWREGSHVALVGWQARGTTGRALVDGARSVRILGEPVAVRARIHTLGGFSAHAGHAELLDWARPMLADGATVALVHGEDDARAALAAALHERGTRDVHVPSDGDTLSLHRRGAPA